MLDALPPHRAAQAADTLRAQATAWRALADTPGGPPDGDDQRADLIESASWHDAIAAHLDTLADAADAGGP